MFMSLPLVLGGYGRNMFINLGFALGNSAMFYGVPLLCQYLGSGVLAPSLAAWFPLFIFALLASWERIRIRNVIHNAAAGSCSSQCSTCADTLTSMHDRIHRKLFRQPRTCSRPARD